MNTSSSPSRYARALAALVIRKLYLRYAEFHPDQPRDEHGMWTSDGGSGTHSEPGGAHKERKALENAMMNHMDKAGVIQPGMQWPSQANYETRGQMKQVVNTRIANDLTKSKHFDGDAAAAKAASREIIDTWANTSGDSHARAIGMQKAVQAEFNLQDAETKHFGSVSVGLQKSHDRAYVRTEYEHTQQMLKANKIDYVTVYRGQSGLPNSHESGPVEVTMQPASSWTTSFKTAEQFGSKKGGHMLVARVPRSRVLSTATTGRGCLNESEVLLLGGKMKVFAVARWRQGWKTEAKQSVVKAKKKSV